MRKYDITDHTADIGLIAYGGSRKEVFANAALGMLELINDRSRVRPREERRIAVEADDSAGLLAAFLSELLYLLEVERFATHHVTVDAVSDTKAAGVAHGEPVAPHHEFRTAVKAVTHHDLEVKKTSGGWQARVLFDI